MVLTMYCPTFSQDPLDNLDSKNEALLTLSKQQSRKLPPIPENYSLNSNTLFHLLAMEREPEQGDTIRSRTIRKKTNPRPLSNLIKLSNEDTPELKYINAIRYLRQNNDPALKNMEIPVDKNCMTASESLKFDNTKINSTNTTFRNENQSQSEPRLHQELLDLKKIPFGIHHSTNILIKSSEILAQTSLEVQPCSYTTVPVFKMLADILFQLDMSENLCNLEFYILTIENNSKIIIHNPTNKTCLINRNDTLFKISARTQATFVPIKNSNVEFSDMYLPNLSMPVDITLSDPKQHLYR